MMSNFKIVKLLDVCQIESGGTPSSSNSSFWGGAINWATLADVKNKYINSTKRKITPDGLKNSSAKILPIGTVLFSSRATIGEVSIANIELATNQGFKNFICDKSKILPEYLYYVLKNGAKNIADSAPSTTFKEISKSKISEYKIPLPLIDEQKRIVKILDKADSLRQKRKQTIGLSDNYLKSVFLEMFGDPIGNPKNWSRKKLGEITNISSGGTPNRKHDEYYGGDIPWVKTTEVNGHLILKTQEFITEVGLKNSSCHLYPKDSIIIAMYGQGKTRGQVGVLGIEATTNQACGVLYPNKSYNTIYIFKLLQYSYDNLRNLGRGGNQPNLNAGILKNYQVIFPPIDVQAKYSKVVEKTEIVKQKMLLQSQELNTQFKALMQRSFQKITV